MRTALASASLFLSAAASAHPGYRPFVLGGGEVAILQADGGLRDWRAVRGSPHDLLVHDRTAQWYRVRVERTAGCRFEAAQLAMDGAVPVADQAAAAGRSLVAAYGTDLQHLFGPGMWIQTSAYPYRRCTVRSTRPVPTPADQIGVDYASEYTPTVYQAVAQRVHCREQRSSFWSRPMISSPKPPPACR